MNAGLRSVCWAVLLASATAAGASACGGPDVVGAGLVELRDSVRGGPIQRREWRRALGRALALPPHHFGPDFSLRVTLRRSPGLAGALLGLLGFPGWVLGGEP